MISRQFVVEYFLANLEPAILSAFSIFAAGSSKVAPTDWR
jgi:hypothetical protein